MFQLKIATDAAAFGDTPDERAAEIARILRSLADRIEFIVPEEARRPVRDANGNTVGEFMISDKLEKAA